MPRTIVITGTGTGIGRATVTKFAAQGWNVVATVRKESDLEAHADMPCVKTLLLDVDDEGASVPFAQRALEQFGNSSTGSDPAVTADVIYRAVVDPDPTAVRYYSASIPRGKRILGADGYWQEFRNAVPRPSQ
jgi:NAD(P)-dependent dehydrogenase (short-subunit alcohol dehydrogenase family)